MSQQQNNDMQQHFYRASAADFGKIPGNPIGYWVSEKLRDVFTNCSTLGERGPVRIGLQTGNNERFVRFFWEVDFIKLSTNWDGVVSTEKKWFPYNKGGEFKKWLGAESTIVNWENKGQEIIKFQEYLNSIKPASSRMGIANSSELYFKQSISWSKVSSGEISFRHFPIGYAFDVAGPSIFATKDHEYILGLLNSKIVPSIVSILSPTLNYEAGAIRSIPIKETNIKFISDNVNRLVCSLIKEHKIYEDNWSFQENSLVQLHTENPTQTLAENYQAWWDSNQATIAEMQNLEVENNRLFIEAYGLQDELTPEVPLSEITLTCNPHYRYGGNLTDNEREARLQSDTIAELISYAIGCMMGRYSLDRDGLVYAHAGNEGFKALVEAGAYATFAADDDGILPLSGENWFSDDIAARFEQFIATAWSRESLEENLNFIADSLTFYAVKPAKKGGETARETIRRYLSSQFYKDHLKTYKKRPIYWLFSSGKEKAFECLVYLHRYSESTLPRMRTEYVTPLLGQMASRIERKRMEQTEASTAEAKRIAKEIDSLTKQLSELRAFDDQLKHHADMRITLDLDDGVKVNYGKFGTLLSDVKAITGDKGE